MAISKKKAPPVQDPHLSRVLNQVYDDMNEIVNAVNNSEVTREDKPFSGKEGDLRLVKTGDSQYELQGRSAEGWVTTTMNYKEK
jgi:hypothetical protein